MAPQKPTPIFESAFGWFVIFILGSFAIVPFILLWLGVTGKI